VPARRPAFYYYADGKRVALEPIEAPLHAAEAARPAAPGDPVFRHGEATIVVLPEVRVEIEPSRAAQLARVAAEAGGDVDVEDRGGGSYVVRPRSGRGTDALAIANAVHERLGATLAQARFRRIVPKR
jgi:hypothetical protein